MREIDKFTKRQTKKLGQNRTNTSKIKKMLDDGQRWRQRQKWKQRRDENKSSAPFFVSAFFSFSN